MFQWPVSGGGLRLGIMVEDGGGTRLRRLAVWLTDDVGHLAAPVVRVLDGGERPVVTLGKDYEFHVDTFNRRNRIVDQAWNADGPALMRLGDSTVLWATPTADALDSRPVLVLTHEGRFVPQAAVGPAAVFFAWQLRLLVGGDPERYIVLGDYQAPASK